MTTEQLLALSGELINCSQYHNSKCGTKLPDEVYAAHMASAMILNDLAGAILKALNTHPEGKPNDRAA